MSAVPIISFALLLGTAAEDPVRAGLEVDASQLGDAAEAIGARLRRRGEEVLRDADVQEVQGASDPVVHVVVEPLPEEAGYRCSYELHQEGEPVDGTQAATECRLCTDQELEEQVSAAIGRLLSRLRSEPDPDAEGPASAPPPPAVVDAGARPWVIGRMGQAGIGLSVVGAAALGVGLGLAISEPILLSKGGTRTGGLSTSGIVTAAVGGAILISGVVLLAVDQNRSRARPVSAGPGGLRVRF